MKEQIISKIYYLKLEKPMISLCNYMCTNSYIYYYLHICGKTTNYEVSRLDDIKLCIVLMIVDILCIWKNPRRYYKNKNALQRQVRQVVCILIHLYDDNDMTYLLNVFCTYLDVNCFLFVIRTTAKKQSFIIYIQVLF